MKNKPSRFRENKQIYVTGTLLGLLLVSLIAGLLYFEFAERKETLARPENNRYEANGKRVIRGNIETADRVVIARTDSANGEDARVYPFGVLFSEITGYSAMGRTALESSMNRDLMTSSVSLWSLVKADLLEQRTMGDTVVTTIDSDLQHHCYELLAGRNGSITVMEPNTGRILAMVSSPTFDPNTVRENWDSLTSPDNDTGILLNRCTQGLYAPGSTFKLITAMEYMREHPSDYQNYRYTCTGHYTLNGETVLCGDGTGHGEVDLEHAIAYSCNAAFIDLGLTLNVDGWKKLTEELGFGKKLLKELPGAASTFSLTASSNAFEVMQTSFGQGKTMETPLQNLLITCMIANNGIMVWPSLIDSIVSEEGEQVSSFSPAIGDRILTSDQALYLKNSMAAVVSYGTTPQAGTSVCKTAGKSGTAQYASSFENMHAWFTGYAPASFPEIAITVMLEKGGSGSMDAAPLFSDIVTYYYTR